MKPFDLEKAKAGHPVCTVGGLPARIICFDRQNEHNCPIVALVTLSRGVEKCVFYTTTGQESCAPHSIFNLRMVSEKHTQYAIIDLDTSPIKLVGPTLFPTVEGARAYADGNPIATVTWEE